MKIIGAGLLGLVGGFVIGLVLSELLAVVALIVFDEQVGIRHLPTATAVVAAAIAVAVVAKKES